MNQYAFVCSKCSHEVAEELVVNVTVTYTFRQVQVDEGGIQEIFYGPRTFTGGGGEVIRYQCEKCGWIVRTPGPEGKVITEPADLAAWLEKYGRKIV